MNYAAYSGHPDVPDFGAVAGGTLSRKDSGVFEYIFTGDDDYRSSWNKYLEILDICGFKFRGRASAKKSPYLKLKLFSPEHNVIIILGSASGGYVVSVEIEYGSI